jgi:hypothetical protein
MRSTKRLSRSLVMNFRSALSVILIGAFLAAASGCGGAGNHDRAEPSSTRTAGPDYEAQVNALCAELIDQVLPITGDKPNPSPREFLRFGEKIDPVIERFDSKVDALEVSEADRSADEAFDAYRSKLDAADAALRKVARTGDVDAFATAFNHFLNELRSSPEKTRLSAQGIVCSAR